MFRTLATSNSSLARWLRRRASRHVSTQSPIIIGGSQRSGTTLLRVILDSHPHIACGPETSLLTGGFLPGKLSRRFDFPVEEIWQLHERATDHAHFVELFLTQYAANRGKTRWAEKTPQNVSYLPFIFRHFPSAKFIHLVRDGRDAVCSIRTHPKFRMMNGQQVVTNVRRPLRPCIESWLRDTEAGMCWRGHPQYLEIHYEKLVTDLEPTLRQLCEFINEPWHAAMLEYHSQDEPSRDPTRFIANAAATQPLTTQAVHRWRKELSADELRLFNQLAGKRMIELGYQLDSDDSTPALNYQRDTVANLKQGTP
ncbi:MAG: sulfotransferase [Verrucomicrobia bacterium]|nr:sulfotransferase [Verrucomicrobiota bacterium]